MTHPVIINFAIPADNDYFDVLMIESDLVGTLAGCKVYLRVYEQVFGVPVLGVDPLIEKSSLSGGGIEILDSPPMTVSIAFTKADTLPLLRNYYCEVTVENASGDLDTTSVGILTITASENRIS